MSSRKPIRHTAIAASVLVAATLTAHATLPAWLQHIVGASTIEAALYRAMPLPLTQVLYPRPPKEAETELAHLISSAPEQAELYALRARADESALDFAAAESDWKLYTAKSKDPIAAKLELADFYHRRLLVPQELQTLGEVAAAPPLASERFVAPPQQRGWQTFQRELALAGEQGLPPQQINAIYAAFLARYPDQPAVYASDLQVLFDERDYTAAESVIAAYRKALPADAVFPIRAQALLEYRRGNIDKALAVYDQAFQPLWPADLVQSYFALLNETHRQRAFVAEARARLAQHPDGPEALNALARTFYYEQQQGHLEQAQQTLDAFRIAREAHNGQWTALDLFTLAALSDSIHSYAEVARYDYALASTPGPLPSGEPAAQAGLSGLVRVLLAAPDQPIALGAGNLTLYRDIATLDQGPGYWNGILSLWLNGTSPQSEYNDETAKAQSYFHRSKAAELLAELDQKFPAAPERPSLHAELIRAYAQYSESDAVIASGKQFLADFPASPDRIDVANLMADAYARQRNTTAEFALYDSLLAELAAKSAGMPLTAAGPSAPPTPEGVGRLLQVGEPLPDSSETQSEPEATQAASASAPKPPSLSLGTYTPAAPTLPAAIDYARVLDRYLGRLTAEQHLPQALTLLRRQLDANPNDPLLYERLASFMQQNNLSAGQEEVFKLAIARFQQPGWYDKLARFYLREKQLQAYADLTRQVTNIFSGTDLDAYFAESSGGGAAMAIQLNLYAQKRFPHDLVFTRNLLSLYQAPPTRDGAAYEALLSQTWWQADDLRDQFFTFLSRTGRLDAELAQLQPLAGAPATNPVATRELAEGNIWSSHFEQAATPLGSLADLYPAESDIGDRAVSVFRSLSYLDSTPASLTRAVAIETHLAASDPADFNRLATLGDLYAEATSTAGEDLASAGPYWRRIPAIHPGTPAGYLNAATIFWDYFQFDAALAQLRAARDRFQQPTLYGYELGAIEENRHDMPAAIDEYIAAVTHPVSLTTTVQQIWATVDAFDKPPTDAADSNLVSNFQSIFATGNSRYRLLQLANRPATKSFVDQATAKALNQNPNGPALALRADVLSAQHRESEIAALLDQALTHAASADQAAAIGALAQAHTLTTVYEHSLAKQTALVSDPVQKIELNYTLARSLESHKDIAAAAAIIDSVYRANPRILGVVRATTDFYARTNQSPRAIATLLAAAKAANSTLARSFILEAATRANDANDTAQARSLALTLLPSTPYDAQVLAIIATSYARAHDDAGLKQFYEAQLAAVKTAQLTSNERRQDAALLRRGLIPALTPMKDYPGALEQYIALLSAFPEDSSTTQEAALYAIRYSLQPRLLDFLHTTVKQSPKDSRFAILLAQTETAFEDLPAALSAYNSAIAIRKDRADLYKARVAIELRLGLTDPTQLEAAASDFDRLYLLTYKDPQWMVHLAEVRVRQQRPADAVKALETAYITGRPSSAANYFNVASQLETWNLLPQAATFAQQGATLAGENLLTANLAYNETSGAISYARILTRLGHPDEALTALTKAHDSAMNSNAAIAAIDAEIAAAETPEANASEMRRNLIDQRRQRADQQLTQAITAIGTTVQTYFTPEQKLAYAQSLDRMHSTNPQLALTGATSAGLTDREAEWRKQLLLTGPVNNQNGNQQAFVQLERSRLNFAELAQTLEAYAARIRAVQRNGILAQAANAWRDAGDETNELRLTRQLALANDAGLRDRFFDLLLRRDPAAFTALAANGNATLADAAVNYTLTHASLQQASAAINARSKNLGPLWGSASLSLAGLYLAPHQPAGSLAPLQPITRAAFAAILRADDSIADRIAHPSDPKTTLTGDLWFYYASRFGIAQSTVQPATSPGSLPNLGDALIDAEDYLPAELERSPTSPAPYLHLARTYSDVDNYAAALTEYRHALELAPTAPSAVAIHDEMAVMLFRGHRQPEATAEWRAALAQLLRMQQHAIYPESFFTDFKTITRHLGERKLFAALRPDIEPILRGYFAKNGNYRSNELLEAIFKASPSGSDGLNLILALANSAPRPQLILDDLPARVDSASWLSPDAQEAVLLRRIELAQRAASSADASSGGDSNPTQLKLLLNEIYLSRNELAKSETLLASIGDAEARGFNIVTDRIVLATRTGHLAALIDSWHANPESIPENSTLENALASLSKPTPAYKPDLTATRPLREFVFEQKQLTNVLLPTDFLALAQSRLDTNDLPGALTLLRRLSLLPPAAPGDLSVVFSETPAADASPNNIDSAASILEKTSHSAEAIPFLDMLVKSEPWNAGFRLRLAEAQLKTSNRAPAMPLLVAVINDTFAPYQTRTQAALDVAAAKLTSTPSQFNSAELNLLASADPAPAASRQPYFVAARIASASAESTSRPDRLALLREAIAIAPSGAGADQARIHLLLLQDENANPSATIAIVPEVFGVASSNQPAEGERATTQPAEDPAADDATGPSPVVNLPPSTASLDLPTRIHLAEILASAFRRDNEPEAALAYLNLAVTLSPTPAAALVHRRDELKAQLTLDRRNATRRPILRRELDQPNQVRPRLTLAQLAHLEAR